MLDEVELFGYVSPTYPGPRSGQTTTISATGKGRPKTGAVRSCTSLYVSEPEPEPALERLPLQGGGCGAILLSDVASPGSPGPDPRDKGVYRLPLFTNPVAAGFPSPADDYVEKRLDLNELCIRHPAASFFCRVKGDSMVGAGIFSGDILVVDRSLTPRHNSIVVALVDGEFTVKRLGTARNTARPLYLLPANPLYEAIRITAQMQFEVWGVATYVVHSLD